MRLTHWTIAAAVVVNAVFLDGDALAHIWVGYAVVGLLALRLLWGVVGPEPARFASFPISVSGALDHIGAIRQGAHRAYRSHNPLGAIMAYALWGMLAMVSVTGVMLESEPFPETDRAHGRHEAADDDELELIEALHEISADILLVLAALHVGGVAFEARRSGRNLVRPMLFGDRF